MGRSQVHHLVANGYTNVKVVGIPRYAEHAKRKILYRKYAAVCIGGFNPAVKLEMWVSLSGVMLFFRLPQSLCRRASRQRV